MKIIKFTLLFIYFLFINKINKAEEKKFEFGLSFFPNYSVSIVSHNGQFGQLYQEGVQSFETWKPSISINLFAEYVLNEKSSFGFGLGYMNNGEQTKKTTFIFIDPILGYIPNDPALPSEGRLTYNSHHIEIPLYYKYKFGKRFYALGGISGTFNISNKITSIEYYNDGSVKKNTYDDQSTNFRLFNIYGNFGLGIDYLQRESYSLFVMPFFQYGLMKVSKSSPPINRSFMSLGITTGLRF